MAKVTVDHTYSVTVEVEISDEELAVLKHGGPRSASELEQFGYVQEEVLKRADAKVAAEGIPYEWAMTTVRDENDEELFDL